MQGKFTIGNAKYKKFVEKYKDIIEIMKKNHCLSDMTIFKYNLHGKSQQDSSEEYFFNYICDHKNDIAKIKNVALRIKKLGIDTIVFGEELNFDGFEYKMCNSSSDFKFFENIEVLPTYSSSYIRYKSNGSCYCITVTILGSGTYQEISDFGREIELNSLIFDPNRLPNEITKETTIDVITKQMEESKKEYQSVRNSVDMSVSTDDLMEQFKNTKETIEKIDNPNNNEQLKQILNNILDGITELQQASSEFEKQTIDSSKHISKEIIKTEKKAFLSSRNNFY